MKKLLALILCVMLFVSVIPTSAFAATTVASASGWAEKVDSKKAAKAARDAIEAMYTAMAVDQTVFNSAKAFYDFSDGLAKSLFANTEKATSPDGKVTKYQEDLVKNTRKFLNSVIGAEISSYLDARKDLYSSTDATTKQTTIDPAKYMKVYAEAASKALGSEKAQKGIEAVALAIMAAGVQADMNDRAKDLKEEIKDWGNWDEFGSAFGKKFFGDYTVLQNPVLVGVTADGKDVADVSFLFAS